MEALRQEYEQLEEIMNEMNSLLMRQNTRPTSDGDEEVECNNNNRGTNNNSLKGSSGSNNNIVMCDEIIQQHYDHYKACFSVWKLQLEPYIYSPMLLFTLDCVVKVKDILLAFVIIFPNVLFFVEEGRE